MTPAPDAPGIITPEQADMLALDALQSSCREPTRNWQITRLGDRYVVDVAVEVGTTGKAVRIRGEGNSLAVAVRDCLMSAGLMPPQ